MRSLPAIAFALAVFAAAVFAFSPRPIPEFPAAELRTDRLLLLDATRAGSRLVAVGERGRVLLSDDEGLNWREAVSPTGALLTAVHFMDARRGWAVGHDAVVLRSDDGGGSWRIVHAAPQWEQPLLDVWFRDEKHGIAVGAYGLYLETGDGGTTWTRRTVVDGDRHMNAIAAGTDGRLLIAGESGLLLASGNGGAHWQPLRSPYAGSFLGALSVGGGHFAVFGLRGHAYGSPDFGRSWRRAAVPGEAALAGGAVVGTERIVLVGADGAVVDSRDAGGSFVPLPGADGAAYSAVLPAAGGDLLLFGERGVSRMRNALRP